MDHPEKKSRGGARPGAGRPTKYAETKVMRVPAQYETAIRALIAHLDANAYLTSFHDQEVSEPVFVRSLELRPMRVTVTVEPA